VEILPRDEDTMVVYCLPRSKEITREDKQVGFEAQVGRLQLTATFNTDEMRWQDSEVGVTTTWSPNALASNVGNAGYTAKWIPKG
jgi:hypothetical protein